METEPQYKVSIVEYSTGKGATLRLTQNNLVIAETAKFNNCDQIIILSRNKLSAKQYQAVLAGLIELGNLSLKWSAEQ